MHAWDPLTPIEETLSFLDSAVRAGKIRYPGLSNFTGWQLQLAVSTARSHGYAVPVTLQAQYNLAVRETELEMIPAARHNGLGILAWSPLASGFLTGKYDRNQPRADNTRAGQGDPLYNYTSANYEHADATWTAVDVLRQVAADTGAEPAAVALSWVINRPGVVCAIVGARTADQLRRSLDAANLQLPVEAVTTLNEATTAQVAAYPYGPFGAAQRNRVSNGPEALGELVEMFADTKTT